MPNYIPFFAATLLFAACTNELTVKPTPITSSVTQPVKGIPYYLPATALEVTVAYTVTGCVAQSGKPTLTVVAATEIKPVRQPDRSVAFVIDYTSLQSPFKHSKITVNRHPDGTLASINAASDDKTLEIATALVKAASAIGGLGFLRSLGLGPAMRTAGVCDPMTAAVKKRDRIAKQIKRATKDILELRAANPELTDPVKKKINGLRAQIGAWQKLLAPLSAATSLTLKATILPTVATNTYPIAPGPGAAMRLAFKNPADRQSAADGLAAELTVTAQQALGALPAPADLGTHLIYREPGPAAVRLECDICIVDKTSPTPRLLLKREILMAQFGLHFTLPFVNGVFDDNVLTVTFDELGLLKSATYESEASFQDAALLAQGIAETIEEDRKQRSTQAVADADNRNKLLAAEIKRLELEAQLSAARAAAGN